MTQYNSPCVRSLRCWIDVIDYFTFVRHLQQYKDTFKHEHAPPSPDLCSVHTISAKPQPSSFGHHRQQPHILAYSESRCWNLLPLPTKLNPVQVQTVCSSSLSLFMTQHNATRCRPPTTLPRASAASANGPAAGSPRTKTSSSATSAATTTV